MEEIGCLSFMCMKEVKHVSASGLYSSEIGFKFVDVDSTHMATLVMLS
jgi:hypothetical protein